MKTPTRRQSQDTPSSGALKPAFNTPAGCPFEHVVIPNEQLHPRLQEKIKNLGRLLSSARSRALFLSLTASTIPMWPSGLATPLATAICAVLSWKIESSSRIVRKIYLDAHALGNACEDEVKNFTAFSLLQPYRSTAIFTRSLGYDIENLVKTKESPFFRHDATDLLTQYHYGVVDNKGDLVLFKHPLADNAPQLSWADEQIKLEQFNQPFQRTRFELSPPTLREEQKAPESVQKSQFAMAPVPFH